MIPIWSVLTMTTHRKSSKSKKTLAPAPKTDVLDLEHMQQWDSGLFDNYEKKILDLKNLVQICGLINTEMDMSEMTQSLLYSWQGTMLTRSVTLFMLKNIVSNVYAYGASVGFANENFFEEFTDEDPLIITLLGQKKTLWVRECADSEFIQPSLSKLSPLEPELIIPMLHKDRLSGFLVVGQKLTGESFSSSEVDFMTNLANLAAIATENLRLFEMATRDRMTNLYVHHYFQNRLEEEIARALRYRNHRLALLMFDIDHFKSVNDTWGHQAGDIVIKEIASIIREKLRKLDMPARYGGEEFAVILPEADAKSAFNIAERIRSTVQNNLFTVGEGKQLQVTISAGTSDLEMALAASEKDPSIPNRESQVRTTLIGQADVALYHSKHNGRNRSTVFTPGMEH